MTSLEGWGSAIELRPHSLAGRQEHLLRGQVITRSVPASGAEGRHGKGRRRRRRHGAVIGIRWTGRLPSGLRDVAQLG
jgi:hypothetical protein